MMDSRVVNLFSPNRREFTAKTPSSQMRKEERSREKLPGNPRFSLWTLCDLGVLAVNFFDSFHHPGFHQEPIEFTDSDLLSSLFLPWLASLGFPITDH
jgi:hypothetical protein